MRQHQKVHDEIIKLVLTVKKDAGTMETHLKEVEKAIRENRLPRTRKCSKFTPNVMIKRNLKLTLIFFIYLRIKLIYI